MSSTGGRYSPLGVTTRSQRGQGGCRIDTNSNTICKSSLVGELRYDAVGIPYVMDLEPSRSKVSSLLYDHIESPIRLKLPGPGVRCTQYYHGLCFNALLKLAAAGDVEGARTLLESKLIMCTFCVAIILERKMYKSGRFVIVALQRSFNF